MSFRRSHHDLRDPRSDRTESPRNIAAFAMVMRQETEPLTVMGFRLSVHPLGSCFCVEMVTRRVCELRA